MIRLLLAVWSLGSLPVGLLLGRLMRRDDEHEQAATLPHPMDDDGWDEWLTVWPTADDAEQAVYDALFAAIPLVAADLRDHA